MKTGIKEELRFIKEIVAVRDLTLTLRFDNGEVLCVDYTDFLKSRSKSPESIYRPLLNPAAFATVRLNAEGGHLEWPNGVDFCPDTTYMRAKEQAAAHHAA